MRKILAAPGQRDSLLDSTAALLLLTQKRSQLGNSYLAEEGRIKLLPEQAAQAKGPETRDRWQIHGVRQESDPNTSGSHVAQCRLICSPPVNTGQTSKHQATGKTENHSLGISSVSLQLSGSSFNHRALRPTVCVLDAMGEGDKLQPLEASHRCIPLAAWSPGGCSSRRNQLKLINFC